MKRDVKLKRRDMKREIKRLKEENKALKTFNRIHTFPYAKQRKETITISSAQIITAYAVCEETIEFAKEKLAHDLGEYILKSGFCEIYEDDCFLGHEIRISCEIVK